MKKLLATITALVMALTLVPAAWADGKSGAAGDETTSASDPYSNMNDALLYVSDGSYKLKGNVTLSTVYEINGDTLTIDLNGHTITGSNVRALHVKSGSLTLTGTGTVTTVRLETAGLDTDKSVIRVGDNNATAAASLTVESGVVIDAPATYGISIFGKMPSTLNFNGKIIYTCRPAIAGNGGSTLAQETININDGAELVRSENADCTLAIYNPQAGTTTIGKASITGGIEAKSGTVKINGATITSVGDAEHDAKTDNYSTAGYAIAAVNTTGGYPGNPVFNITDGTITGPVAVLQDASNIAETRTAKISISGGTFSSDPSDFVANGYVANGTNGTWTVTKFASGETKTTTTTAEGKTTTTVDKINIDTAATKATTVEINAKDETAAGEAAATTTVTIKQTVADALKTNSEKIETVEVKTNVATLTIDKNALKTLTETTGDLVLTVSKSETSTTETKFDLTATVDDTPVFKNSNGKITITVPMDAPGFRQQLVCYYVNGNTRTRMGGAGYKDGSFSWDTNHFSEFVVVTETVSNSRASINISGSSTGTTATTTTTTTTTGKASSATTFDAGVGIYAVSAILSVTGMAWVGKKKH